MCSSWCNQYWKHPIENGECVMAWVLLAVAGVFEVVWAYFMKVSDGFTKLTPSILTIIFMIASFAFVPS